MVPGDLTKTRCFTSLYSDAGNLIGYLPMGSTGIIIHTEINHMDPKIWDGSGSDWINCFIRLEDGRMARGWAKKSFMEVIQ